MTEQVGVHAGIAMYQKKTNQVFRRQVHRSCREGYSQAHFSFQYESLLKKAGQNAQTAKFITGSDRYTSQPAITIHIFAKKYKKVKNLHEFGSLRAP